MAQVRDKRVEAQLLKAERRTEVFLKEQARLYIEAINRATGRELKLRADEET